MKHYRVDRPRLDRGIDAIAGWLELKISIRAAKLCVDVTGM